MRRLPFRSNPPSLSLSGSPRRRRRLGVALGAAGLLVMASAAALATRALLAAGPMSDGTGVTPEGWKITPAGAQTPVGGGPLAVAVTPDGDRVLVEDAGYGPHALVVLDAHTGKVLQTFPGAEDGTRGYYLGLVISRDGRAAYASDGAGSAIHRFAISRGALTEGREIPLTAGTWPAGLALSDDGTRLHVAGNLTDDLLTVDLPSGKVSGDVAVGHLPYGVALSPDGRRAFVTSWGGNTVTVVDLDRGRVVASPTVGSHPSAVVGNPARGEIYVANTDSDTISVLDARSAAVLRTIDLRDGRSAAPGKSPDDLAVTKDGGTLFVASAGFNQIDVVALAARGGTRDSASDHLLGAIPTGWYPSGVALDPRAGDTLFVINMKGLGIGPVAPDQYIGDLLQGTLSRIALPEPARLAAYTREAESNLSYAVEDVRDREAADSQGARSVVPARIGHPTPIRHVIYVMKENRTYDQVLGDLDRGNGDPHLAIFGRSVTPNQHELARRFVTFDNFYCDGEVSADGWTWSSAANANTYNQKNWPLDYGSAGRLYDFGGFGDAETAAFPGNDPTESFLWDRLSAKGISYRNYGFFVNGAPVEVDASMVHLRGKTSLTYPGWDLDVPDQARVDDWLREFRRFEQQRAMPTVQFVYLPRDHTVGTSPGEPTPAAMVADNDLALGRLVEAVSASAFWRDTVIFVLEDDAQDGPDHVDGHRTVAQVISPYTQTGKVDSTFYSTVSMLKTMELIVGVAPLTAFDARATPMCAAFSTHPDLAAYRSLTPEISLTEVSAADAPLAARSARLDFSRPDSADPRVLNLAIWQSVRGGRSVPPARHLAAFTPRGGRTPR